MGFALYVHIPFCGQRCSYCHFQIKVLHPRTDSREVYERYLNGLTTELTHLGRKYTGTPLTSVFIGGGTPSRMGVQNLTKVLETIKEQFVLTSGCEVTVEVNPEDVVAKSLKTLKDAGYNRISLGIQSFHDPSLKAIGRPHDSGEALIALAFSPTFEKGISFDLILGLPYQTMETLNRDLDHIAHLAPEHISIYLLEKDVPTPLDKKGLRFPMPDEDLQADFYEHARARLLEIGYQQYEISNFSMPGYRCRHNMVYWECGDYIAAGPSAVGRVGRTLTMNHDNYNAWLEAVEQTGSGVESQEDWTEKRWHQEQMIQGLRLLEGVPKNWLTQEDLVRLENCASMGLVDMAGTRVKLTERGLLLGNEVFQQFVGDDL